MKRLLLTIALFALLCQTVGGDTSFMRGCTDTVPWVPPNLKGIGLGHNFWGSDEDLVALNTDIVHNWAFTPEHFIKFRKMGIEYVAMLDGNYVPDEVVRDYAMRYSDAKFLMFNEPEIQGYGVYKSIPRAVDYFEHYTNKLINPRRIVVGNVIALDAWGWLRQFVAEYYRRHGTVPPVLGYAGHAYAEDCFMYHSGGWDPNVYKAWLQDFVDLVHGWDPKAEVWFTEYGTLCPNGMDPEQVMQAGAEFCEAGGHRYFWFATYSRFKCRDGVPFEGQCIRYPSGGLTRWGEAYRRLP